MSNEAVRGIVESKLEADWASLTPIVWDNQDYSPLIGVSFIRTKIEGVFSEPRSPGCQREHYLMTVEVYTPSNTGAAANMAMADIISAMFYGFAYSTLTVKNTRVERVGDEEEWHRRDVLIELQYEQHY